MNLAAPWHPTATAQGAQALQQGQPAPPIPPLPARPGAATGAQAGAPVAPGGAAQEAATSAQATAQETRDAIRDAVRTTIQSTVQPGEPVINVPPPYRQSDIPPEVIPLVGMSLGLVVAMVVGYPIARAIGRVIEKRGTAGLVRATDVAPQLQQLQASVDTMAIELERISEAQRFTAKLMSERPSALASGDPPRG